MQVDAVLDYDKEFADMQLGDRLPTSLQPDILEDRFEESNDVETSVDTATDPDIPLHVEFYLTQALTLCYQPALTCLPLPIYIPYMYLPRPCLPCIYIYIYIYVRCIYVYIYTLCMHTCNRMQPSMYIYIYPIYAHVPCTRCTYTHVKEVAWGLTYPCTLH